MAQFQIIGLNDCPNFAKAEKLSEEIVALNPTIEFHKEMKDRFLWADFCDKMKRQQGWEINTSPVIFEVLVESDGKASLIGDINDFCEFAAMYFDIYYDPTSSALLAMSMKNKTLFGRGFDGQDRGDAAIFNLAIVNAPLQMLELLLTQLLSPVSMIPAGMLLNIQIYDENTPSRVLNGILMEIFDLASPILFKATISISLPVCLYRCQLFILCEDFSRGFTEEPTDWIDRVEMQVTNIITAFNDKRAKTSDCRILVGGEGPQCYIAEMLREAIPSAKAGPGRIVASGQYVAQRAKSEIARIGDVPAGCIVRIHAWGWPGETGAYVEVKDAVLRGAELGVQGPGVEIPLAEVATNSDNIFLKFPKEFLQLQKKRLLYTVPQGNHFMCMAESIVTTIHIWFESEPQLFSKSRPGSVIFADPSRDKDEFIAEKPGSLHVLNVGVRCADEGSVFPSGTFMVQPAICVNGRWRALGKISEKTNESVIAEVSKLWGERQKLIFRHTNIAKVFPELKNQEVGKTGDDISETEKEARDTQDEIVDRSDSSASRAAKSRGEMSESDIFTIDTKEEEEEE